MFKTPLKTLALLTAALIIAGCAGGRPSMLPNPDKNLAFAVHGELICKNGIFNHENLDFTALIADRKYQFAYIFSPAPGTIVHTALGHIDWAIVAAVTLGAVPGALIGARIALGTQERTLRLAVGSFLLIVAVAYGVSEAFELLRC